MWAAINGLSLGVKAAILGGFLLFLLALGGTSYIIGRNDGKNISAVAIAEYSGKVQALNTALVQANSRVTEKIVPEYIDRTNTIRETVYRNSNTIKDAVPTQGNLSEGWIHAYNQSIQGKPIDFNLARVATPSKFTDNIALQKIAANNGVCLANAEQLNALSKWVQEVYENGQKVSASDID